MTRTFIAAAAFAALSSLALSGAAQAQSGGGGAVVNQAPPEGIVAAVPTFDTGSEGMPHFDGPVIHGWNNATLPERSGEGPVQSANSMPLGAGSPGGTSSVETDRMAALGTEQLITGKIAPNNGSGIPQTYASLPNGWTEGTVPQMTSTSTSRYVSAQQARQMQARQAAGMARRSLVSR